MTANTLAGFIAGYYAQHGREATLQEIFDAGVRSGIDRTKPVWFPIEECPTNVMVLFAAEFDGPYDWRMKTGYKNEKGGFVVFGASWKPTVFSYLPEVPDFSIRANNEVQ